MTTSGRWAWLVFGPVALLLGGCGGADFGGDVVVPVTQRSVLAAEVALADPIRLPGDRTFNIHLKSGTRDPGADGTAREESDATAAGDARALAETTNGGTAASEFRVGHALDNQSNKAIRVGIQVELELAHALRASPQPASQTQATGTLRLVVLDGRKRTLANLDIAHLVSDEARAQSSSLERHALDVTFDPNQTYSVILYGKAAASAAADQQASASIDVRNLKMRLTFTPAAPSSQPAEK
ncbi:MAG TPA: hypothetical protein PKY77_08575 [Phycisphaerae bacterium]|nr:hypothetical protein [Phycisphaerae bacterium]HRY67228.1 hypothetical protein [Phycisphaerae bacterium]HSA26402.1 hypothetical protein [Phycisphaerae bacterium]